MMSLKPSAWNTLKIEGEQRAGDRTSDTPSLTDRNGSADVLRC